MLIRLARPDDAMDVARVHVRAWQAGYRGLLPDSYLDALCAEERARRYDFATQDPGKPATLVALIDNAVCGFATTAPVRDEDAAPELGELCALYIDPDHWRCGVGTALIRAARQRLVEHGFRHAVLWLLAGNARADRFYRLDAWQPDARQRSLQVWGITVDELRYQRPLDTTPPRS